MIIWSNKPTSPITSSHLAALRRHRLDQLSILERGSGGANGSRWKYTRRKLTVHKTLSSNLHSDMFCDFEHILQLTLWVFSAISRRHMLHIVKEFVVPACWGVKSSLISSFYPSRPHRYNSSVSMETPLEHSRRQCGPTSHGARKTFKRNTFLGIHPQPDSTNMCMHTNDTNMHTSYLWYFGRTRQSKTSFSKASAASPQMQHD